MKKLFFHHEHNHCHHHRFHLLQATWNFLFSFLFYYLLMQLMGAYMAAKKLQKGATILVDELPLYVPRNWCLFFSCSIFCMRWILANDILSNWWWHYWKGIKSEMMTMMMSLPSSAVCLWLWKSRLIILCRETASMWNMRALFCLCADKQTFFIKNQSLFYSLPHLFAPWFGWNR